MTYCIVGYMEVAKFGKIAAVWQLGHFQQTLPLHPTAYLDYEAAKHYAEVAKQAWSHSITGIAIKPAHVAVGIMCVSLKKWSNHVVKKLEAVKCQTLPQ